MKTTRSKIDLKLEIVKNRRAKVTFLDLEPGAVVNYVGEEEQDTGTAIFLQLIDSKFGKMAEIIWTDTFDREIVLADQPLNEKYWNLLFR